MPNELGVHDLIGNALELLQDVYAPAYLACAPLLDPVGPDSGTGEARHVTRGCAPLGETVPPDWWRVENRWGDRDGTRLLGFRTARSIRLPIE
jgi:formylglycine-generating enzyme required for sulfatase activity